MVGEKKKIEENDFSDIDDEIYIKSIFRKYYLWENDTEEVVENIKKLFNEFKIKKYNFYFLIL